MEEENKLLKQHKKNIQDYQVKRLLEKTSGTAKEFYFDENGEVQVKNRAMRRAEIRQKGGFKKLGIKI